ncbi:RRG1 (YDR065W) [Zygosaccharomyces parabailii]|nr:RRG1 (YDR065W) [Zygosaccharomyces parabailii]CDH15253.1 related to Required for respiratory growth protein 1, mitochondrial [Zygosaccharomyces bailii ISA1307]
MVTNFIYLPSHRTCVLHLYRHTLRNSHQCCHSMHLVHRIRKIVKQTLVKHRCNKSSWSVHLHLQKLHELNQLLVRGNIKAVWDLLTLISSKKKAPGSSRIISELQMIKIKKTNIMSPSPKCSREMGILNKYIKREQAHDRLPHNISEEYKMNLLLPMALHARALAKLNSIQRKLSQGPPKVMINHTATMGGRIWFVRSALNKKKRQSKALGILIRREKRQSRNRWEALECCKATANWALQEGIWEHFIQQGTILELDLDQYLESFDLDEKYQPPLLLREWLAPVRESVIKLKEINRAKVVYFRNYKNNVLIKGGQAQYYADRSKNFHRERLQRFQEMAKKDLPYVAPFVFGRDLPSVIAKYRL